MLDLGPLHQKVSNHIDKLIDNLGILLGKDILSESATLHGDEWQNPEVVKVIQDKHSSLPHIQDLLIVFLKGAQTT